MAADCLTSTRVHAINGVFDCHALEQAEGQGQGCKVLIESLRPMVQCSSGQNVPLPLPSGLFRWLVWPNRVLIVGLYPVHIGVEIAPYKGYK